MGIKDFFSKNKKRSHVDRAPRVRVNYLHQLEFNARDPKFSAPLKIENISATGIGLIVPPDADFASLEVVLGDLHFPEAVHSLVLKIVRFNGDHVGATIENPTPSFLATLQKYFESEIAAIRLKPTRTDYLKSVPHGTPHWYQGGNNCDLSYVSSGNDAVEFAITVFGNHIEGGAGRTLKYSLVSELAPGETAGYKASALLDQKSKPDDRMLALAKRVVHAVEGLPIDHRESILKRLV